jgi:hypothetical protein
MQSIIFGEEAGEQLRINVLRYERDPVGEYFDDNWLAVEVSIQVGAFSATFRASFLTGELEAFHKQMRVLYESLEGRAEFESLEGQLGVGLIGDGLGHIRLDGKARDRAGTGNTLSFNLVFDQTQLYTSMRRLEAALTAFPVRV